MANVNIRGGSDEAVRFEPHAGETEAFIEPNHVTIENGTTPHVDDVTLKARDARTYRHRLAHTGCLGFNLFALGWAYSILGPSFPDLRLIIKEDLATASWLLTSWAFGALIGSAVGGVAYDNLNKIRLFVSVTLCLGVSVAATPWCTHFFAMLAVQIAHGACAAVLKTAISPDIVLIWREKARKYLHAVTLFFGVGAILSPFVCAPFLAQKLNQPISLQDNHTFIIPLNTSLNTSIADLNITSGSSLPSSLTIQSHIDFGHNNSRSTIPSLVSYNKYEHTIVSLQNATVTVVEMNQSYQIVTARTHVLKDDLALYGETHVHIAYFIASMVCFLAACSYIVVHHIYGNVYTEALPSENQHLKHGQDLQRKYILNLTYTNIFTVMVAVIFMIYIIAERAIGQFLMTFLISALDWKKSDGSNGTSVFWLTTAGARMAAVFVVRRLRLPMIFFISVCLVFLGCGMLWASAVYGVTVIVWVSIGVIGLGVGPLFGSIFSLMAERVRTLTGVLSSVMSIANAIGGMVSPVVIGYLMDRVSRMCFVYVLIVSFMAFSVCITLLFALYRYKQKTLKTSENCSEDSKLQNHHHT